MLLVEHDASTSRPSINIQSRWEATAFLLVESNENELGNKSRSVNSPAHLHFYTQLLACILHADIYMEGTTPKYQRPLLLRIQRDQMTAYWRQYRINREIDQKWQLICVHSQYWATGQFDGTGWLPTLRSRRSWSSHFSYIHHCLVHMVSEETRSNFKSQEQHLAA